MKSDRNASASNVEQGNELRHAPVDDRSLAGGAAKSGPILRIQLLGESGVGKTCFLAGLALLNKQTDGRSFVLPTDDGTKAVFDRLRDTLGKECWPEKTNIVNKLSFAVVRGKNCDVDVQLSDFAGESYTNSMERGDKSEAAKQIQSLVSSADLLLVLLDGASVDQEEDFAVGPPIQAVFQRIRAAGHGNLEVAVVLTKSDLCTSTPIKTSKDLKQLVEKRAPKLAEFLKNQQIHTQWIPVSVCGPDATDASGAPIYASLEPQGYEAIFEQLFRRQRQPRNRLIQRVAAAAVLVILMGVAWMILHDQQVAAEGILIVDPSIPITENPTPVAPENKILVRARYDSDFEKAINDIKASGNVESIALVLKRFEQIPTAHIPLVSKGLERLKTQASDRKEQLLLKLVVDCQQLQTGDCVPLIGKYLSEFPDSQNADDLRKMLEDINLARYFTARGQVKTVPVDSPKALQKKIDTIADFLSNYGQRINAEEKAAMVAARDIATELVSKRQYHCKLIRTSGLDTPRDHGLEIYIARERIANNHDSGDVSEKNWNREFTIDWQSGENIKVTLVNYDTVNQDMAYFENNTPIAIVLLAGERMPSRYATTGNWFGTDFTSSRPDFKIKFQCQELPPEKLKAISDYLLPGDKW